MIERENNGTIFLAGMLSDETGWDGSGLVIVRVESRAAAEADARTDPLCKAGIRTNTVRGGAAQ